MESPKQSDLVTAGGRIRCARCQALSKRTKLQCQAPAMKGKAVCRFHGGKSTGPRTAEGRARCAQAKLIHGRETKAKREQARELNQLLRLYATLLGVNYRSQPITPRRYKSQGRL
jgi:hypothetical protein